MSKSKEIAELLNAEITRTVHLDVMHHEAAAHILAQEAEIERLELALENACRKTDQARDALRVAVEALEFFSRGINGGHIKCASYLDLDPDAGRPEIKSPDTRLNYAIEQTKEALK